MNDEERREEAKRNVCARMDWFADSRSWGTIIVHFQEGRPVITKYEVTEKVG